MSDQKYFIKNNNECDAGELGMYHGMDYDDWFMTEYLIFYGDGDG